MKVDSPVKLIVALCAVLAASCLFGCGPQGAQSSRDDDSGPRVSGDVVANMPLEKNVKGVNAYYSPHSPWLLSEDRSRIIGIAIVSLYLEGPNVLGVFGDGIIRPRLYVLDRVDGKPQPPRLVKEWAFNPEQASGWRSRNRTAQGWGYRLHLLWGDALDLAGQEIRLTIAFERVDGLVVHSGKKDFRVPANASP